MSRSVSQYPLLVFFFLKRTKDFSAPKTATFLFSSRSQLPFPMVIQPYRIHGRCATCQSICHYLPPSAIINFLESGTSQPQKQPHVQLPFPMHSPCSQRHHSEDEHYTTNPIYSLCLSYFHISPLPVH